MEESESFPHASFQTKNVNAPKPPCRTSGSSTNPKKGIHGEPGHYAEKMPSTRPWHMMTHAMQLLNTV
jgi:hypothetical protein